jgi:hypothetical protein
LPTATNAVLAVHAEDDDGHPLVSGVAWGDGSSEAIAIPMYMCPSFPPPTTPPPPDPGESDTEFGHAWRHAGTFTLTVSVESSIPCSQGPPPAEDATVRLVVHVTPGLDTSNGPAQPVVTYKEAGPAFDGKPYEWTVSATLSDDDGYVGTVTIDWGDGSAPATVRNDESCDDADGARYPSYGSLTATKNHVYSPGKYTVTLTYSSAGCGGADVQRGSTTLPVRVESID